MDESSANGTQPKPRRRLTLEQILAAADTEEREIEMPEWGGAVAIRPLTRQQVSEAYRQGTRGNKTDAQLVERLMVCWSVTDPPLTPPDYQALLNKSAAAVQRLVSAVLEASGLGQSAQEKAEAAFPE